MAHTNGCVMFLRGFIKEVVHKKIDFLRFGEVVFVLGFLHMPCVHVCACMWLASHSER